jgi:hypothetical protein
MTSEQFSGTDWYSLSAFQSGLVVSLSLAGALLGSGAHIKGGSKEQMLGMLASRAWLDVGARAGQFGFLELRRICARALSPQTCQPATPPFITSKLGFARDMPQLLRCCTATSWAAVWSSSARLACLVS